MNSHHSSIKTNYDDFSDYELIQKMNTIGISDKEKNGILKVIQKKYYSKVFAKCISILKDKQLAEDATQEIFIKVLTKSKYFNNKASLSTWIYSITHNYCIDEIRRKEQLRKSYTGYQYYTETQLDEDTPYAEILEINYIKLEKSLHELSPEDRSIVDLKYNKNLKINELANILSKSESAIRMQLLRIRQKILVIYETKYGGIGSGIDDEKSY